MRLLKSRNKRILFIAIMVLFVAACESAAPFETPTLSSSTAIAGTSVPVAISTLPAGETPAGLPTSSFPTSLPTLPAGASPTELKYLLLEKFPNLFFCDPDFYPVARADEADLARQVFPQLQAAAEEFQAILNHTDLKGQTSFDDGQKLVIYREHKKLAAIRFELFQNQFRFQLQIAENDRQGFTITGWINSDGNVTVDLREPTIATCPICLAAQTLIDTPGGQVPVENLRPGDPVWTVDPGGARIISAVLNTTRVPVAPGHRMVHIALSDGRELWASPGHPLTDGRSLGDLVPGDIVDGVPAARVELVSYDQPATYDLLPAGGTGFYWANGILIGSTLDVE